LTWLRSGTHLQLVICLFWHNAVSVSCSWTSRFFWYYQ
jgi:hypothetical protein